MFGQVQKIIGNASSSAGYPAKLFPMEVQVAFYRHNPTTRTSLATAAIGSLLLVGLLTAIYAYYTLYYSEYYEPY